MHVLELNADNFKRLRAVHITPPAGMVVVSGKNANGKSSVLDSIMAAIGGVSACPDRPIHGDADSASIRVDLGDIVVTRKFTASGSTVVVENAEGARYKSPQTMLDGFFGRLSFDPLAFLGLAPKEQAAQLRTLVPLSVDVDALDGLNRRDYDLRRDANRDAAALRTQVQGITVPEGVGEPRDLSALLGRVTALQNRRTVAVDADRTTKQAQADLQTKRERLDALRDQERALELDIKALKVKIEGLPDAEDPHEIEAELAELGEGVLSFQADNQRAVAAKNARENQARLAKQALAKETEADALTAAMADREKQKAAALAAAKMPVQGLSFGADGITYNGIPFSQASQAEKLRVSTAIAMASNPKLKVILIRDGSALDSDSIALMAAMAEEHGFQVWVERVSDGDGVGIVIEDGMVLGAAAGPVDLGTPLFPEEGNVAPLKPKMKAVTV